jgi:hypothetical protein
MKVKLVGSGSHFIMKVNGDKRIIALCARKYDAQAIVRAMNKEGRA